MARGHLCGPVDQTFRLPVQLDLWEVLAPSRLTCPSILWRQKHSRCPVSALSWPVRESHCTRHNSASTKKVCNASAGKLGQVVSVSRRGLVGRQQQSRLGRQVSVERGTSIGFNVTQRVLLRFTEPAPRSIPPTCSAGNAPLPFGGTAIWTLPYGQIQWKFLMKVCIFRTAACSSLVDLCKCKVVEMGWNCVLDVLRWFAYIMRTKPLSLKYGNSLTMCVWLDLPNLQLLTWWLPSGLVTDDLLY